MLDETLIQKIDERFKFLVLLTLRVDRKKFREVEKSLTQKKLFYSGGFRFKGFKTLDYLEEFEASLLCFLLLREGLIRGLDFEIFRTPHKGYTLLVKPSQNVGKTVKILDRVRVLSQTKKYAALILDEWQLKGKLNPGDVDEALNLGYEILKVKTKFSVIRCPKCGRRSLSKIFEKIDGENFLVHAKKMCCGFVVRKTIPIKKRLA